MKSTTIALLLIIITLLTINGVKYLESKRDHQT
jgi:hypothetical protein